MKTFSALLTLCEGNPPVTGGFPSQRPVMPSFDIFIELRLNERSRSRWFETPSHSLWRRCNENVFLILSCPIKEYRNYFQTTTCGAWHMACFLIFSTWNIVLMWELIGVQVGFHLFVIRHDETRCLLFCHIFAALFVDIVIHPYSSVWRNQVFFFVIYSVIYLCTTCLLRLS